jgi:hypothetical protein
MCILWDFTLKHQQILIVRLFFAIPTEEPVEHSELKYSMMLIQKFKQLYEASCKLHKIGYYKKWPKGVLRRSSS